MKIIITDNFKDSVAKFIVSSGIVLFFVLLFGIVGGIENGTLWVESDTESHTDLVAQQEDENGI